jgi:hypothetical protein
MLMLRPFLIAFAVCLVAAPAAYADLSYSYVDGAVFRNSVDTSIGEQDGKGIEGRFSYDVVKFLHVFAGAQYVEFDDIPVDTKLIEAGAGVHYSFSDLGSLYFNLSALTIDASGPTIGADDDGYGYAFGYREANKSGKMEFNLSAEHIELSDADSGDTWINMGLLFRVTSRFKITTGVQFAGDENLFRVGVRYYLPSRFDNP